MPAAVLVDTGPIVAYLHRGDAWHAASKRFFQGWRGDLITTWPVVTEAAYLSESTKARIAIVQWLQRNLQVASQDAQDCAAGVRRFTLRSNPFIALFALAAFAVLSAAALPAAAQNYPARPVRIVIAFGPGGIADTIGRLVGQKLGDRFGQTIVGDNRPGAGGALAARIVAAATPDGHTLLVTTTAIAVNATSVKDAIDPRTQLVPVAIAATAPTIFVVHRSVTAKSLLEYLRTTKKGRFNYGTAGVGTSEHLTSEYLFKAVPGLDGTHVPYQGGAAPVTAVVAQQMDMAITTFPTASTFIKQGALRVMAVASRKRIAALPEAPTLGEAGFIDFENASWIAFFAPAKTPAAAVRALHAGIDDALRQADVKDRLTALGFDIQTRTQPDFAAYVKTEVEKWAQVTKATGIQPN